MEYNVIFLDDDRTTVLDVQKVLHGDKVEYKGVKPVKEPTVKEIYNFDGWDQEEKMECVTENLVLIARYSVTVNDVIIDEFYQVSLENAEQANLAAVLDSGKKIFEQQKAIEKDSRTAEQIVADIIENGKTEVGQEQKREEIDR